ncbi:hypothetical protein ACFLS8_05345, partial [Chloroflexota bacterium]
GILREAGEMGEGDFLYRTNNYCADEVESLFDSPEYFDHVGWVSWTSGPTTKSIARNKMCWTMFDRYEGNVGLEFAKMMYRFPKFDEYDLEAYTNYELPTIGNLENVRVGVAELSESDGEVSGTLYLCLGPAGRYNLPYWPA